MKKVVVFDSAGGHAVEWDPDGVVTAFTISDTDVSGFNSAFISVEVATGVDNNYFCDTVD